MSQDGDDEAAATPPRVVTQREQDISRALSAPACRKLPATSRGGVFERGVNTAFNAIERGGVTDRGGVSVRKGGAGCVCGCLSSCGNLALDRRIERGLKTGGTDDNRGEVAIGAATHVNGLIGDTEDVLSPDGDKLRTPRCLPLLASD